MTDIVRCSLVFTDDTYAMKDLYDMLKLLVKDDSMRATANGELPELTVLRVKDRFTQTGSGGYRDMLINVSVLGDDNERYVCEIQLHHKKCFELKNGTPCDPCKGSACPKCHGSGTEGGCHDLYDLCREVSGLLDSIRKITCSKKFKERQKGWELVRSDVQKRKKEKEALDAFVKLKLKTRSDYFAEKPLLLRSRSRGSCSCGEPCKNVGHVHRSSRGREGSRRRFHL